MLFALQPTRACIFDTSADQNVWLRSALRSLRLYGNSFFCDRLRLFAIVCDHMETSLKCSVEARKLMIPGPEMIPKSHRNDPRTGNDPQIGPQMIRDRLTINIKWNGLKFGQWIYILYTSYFSLITLQSLYLNYLHANFTPLKIISIAVQCNRTIYL